ncbi:MAG: hypothetical protein ABMA64_18955 [Myxococcota bacterium]
MASWVVVLLAGSAHALTSDTGGEVTTEPTGATGATGSTGDTAAGRTAAELANEPGGTPCEDGCSTGASGAVGWLWAPALLAAVRRRAHAGGGNG